MAETAAAAAAVAQDDHHSGIGQVAVLIGPAVGAAAEPVLAQSGTVRASHLFGTAAPVDHRSGTAAAVADRSGIAAVVVVVVVVGRSGTAAHLPVESAAPTNSIPGKFRDTSPGKTLSVR